jgi:hypothetical protein
VGPKIFLHAVKKKEYLSPLPEMGEKGIFFRIYMENYIKLNGGTHGITVNECSHV